jgi:perosamine synthetase
MATSDTVKELQDLRKGRGLAADDLRERVGPGSICPLNLLPLFQGAEALLPAHPHHDQLAYREGQFPIAEGVWRNTLKLPVWYREEDLPLVERYVDGFRKVIENHHDLLR